MPLDTTPLLAQLAGIVGDGGLITGDAMSPLATDVYRRLEMPLAVVRPQNVEALQAVVRATAEAGIALSVRGGGASYTDGYVPRDAGQVLVDLSRLNRIITINEEDAFVTVEAGVTWAELKAALDARGLRTPFWGPFSGLLATIGGSVSQNSISHGSGAYGISAESVLSVDVVTADGNLLSTGSAAVGSSPFSRHYGPDLTGLFTGDCGALGIKARVTLALQRQRAAHRPISFAFPDFDHLHEAMRLVSFDRLDESGFALDGALSQGQIARQDRAGAQFGMALSILRSSPSLASGIVQLGKAALSARRDLGSAPYMVHYIVEGVDDGEVKGRLNRMRELLGPLGREIPGTVPAVVRSMPFAPFYNTLGPAGERWVPVHGVLPHSNTKPFDKALAAFLAERSAEMKRLGVWTGTMFSVPNASGFLYEIAIYWPDVITDYHRQVVPADYLEKLPKYPENLEARAYVHQLKSDLVALYGQFGAIHYQIGKAYPYLDRLSGPTAALLRSLKAQLDPQGRISPGVLGL